MSSGASSAQAWRSLVRQIDDMGFDVLHVPQHRGTQGFGPIAALASAAEISSRLRLGSLVLDNESTHPALLAKDLATIDLISDGRLEVGIGAGWLPADHEPLGQEFPHAGERIDKLMEAVEVLRACWTQPTASYGGKHYQLSELANDPLPVQQPYPPLLIGGGGKRVLTYAARVANIVSLVPNMSAGKVGRESAANATGVATSEKLQWVRDAAGSRFNEIELHTNVTNVFITNDRLPMMEKLARGYRLENQQDVFAIPHVVLGTVEQCAEQLLQRRVETGISHYTVFESGLADFGPILQLLAGK